MLRRARGPSPGRETRGLRFPSRSASTPNSVPKSTTFRPLVATSKPRARSGTTAASRPSCSSRLIGGAAHRTLAGPSSTTDAPSIERDLRPSRRPDRAAARHRAASQSRRPSLGPFQRQLRVAVILATGTASVHIVAARNLGDLRWPYGDCHRQVSQPTAAGGDAQQSWRRSPTSARFGPTCEDRGRNRIPRLVRRLSSPPKLSAIQRSHAASTARRAETCNCCRTGVPASSLCEHRVQAATRRRRPAYRDRTRPPSGEARAGNRRRHESPSTASVRSMHSIQRPTDAIEAL